MRFSALKELGDRREIASVKGILLEICVSDPWGPNRTEAAQSLGVLWPDSDVCRVYESCLEGEPYVANSIVRILSARLDPAAVCLLRSRFEAARNARLRYSILQAFCGAGDATTQAFVLTARAHLDEDERVRSLAVSLLSRAEDPALRTVFLETLRDESQRVRAGAVEALGKICSPTELLELLPPYLEDSSNRVRANALVPLLRSGYWTAWSKLRDMVNHTSQIFRSSAAWVLGELIPTPTVVGCLESLARDEDPGVRSRARVSAERLAVSLPAES